MSASEGDPQAQAVYAFERAHIEPAFPHLLDRNQCRRLTRRAAAHLRMPSPALHFMSGLPLPCRARPATWSIEIAEWGKTATTILHETAHLGVLWRGVREAPHGPAFVGAALDLYALFFSLDGEALRAAARRSGLSCAAPAYA